MRVLQAMPLIIALLLMGDIARAQEKSAPESKEGRRGIEGVEKKLRLIEGKIRGLEEENKRLKKELDALKRKGPPSRPKERPPDVPVEDDELKALREEALAEAEAEVKKEPEEKIRLGDIESTIFKSGQLALQALNPEISVVGDFFGRWVHAEGHSYARHGDEMEHSGFEMRTFGVHIESYLDPYSRLKAAMSFHDDKFRLGEAYVTFYSLLTGLNLTAGKFRQQFGVVNRWHLHGLDQVNFPLPLMKVFGHGGLNQSGLSLDWSMPDVASFSEALTVQITNGDNSRLFQGKDWSAPTGLLHYKVYRDISKDTYIELGLTGLLGPNHRRGYIEGGEVKNERHWRWSYVLGADLTLLWEPTGFMRYRNILWRTEFYYLWKELPPPGSDRTKTLIRSYGAYSYIQAKVSRTIEVGVRGDIYLPDHRNFEVEDLVSDEATHVWQVAPYVTWWISPFVKVRLEYDHINGRNLGPEPREHRVYVQLVFAAGPHKHERY
jgi:hypothetical protein